MIELSEPSPMLVVAVGGRIGSGCSLVRDGLIQSLRTYGYEVEIIDVTKVFIENADDLLGETDSMQEDADLPEPAKRIRMLQRNGNRLRRKYGNEIISSLCISEVIEQDVKEKDILNLGKRTAYIIDSLKHPAEVKLLRNVFRRSFYMVGVVASDLVRSIRLKERKGFDDRIFEDISKIDANESLKSDAGEKYGQQTVDAVTMADYFFSNDYATPEQIQSECDRLLKLVFGIQVVSPRLDEVGMQTAFKVAKRSACLSRQVGAAIFDEEGNVLSVGRNDVPRSGGGLYDAESENDGRCFVRGGKCYNDEEKGLIATELAKALKDGGFLSQKAKKDLDELAKYLLSNTRIRGLIEFSRAVHAEANSIISVARTGKQGLIGSTLFCTTFPCHNCTKHIIDAGIKRVVYLEPYEKSLARKLHGDAVNSPGSEQLKTRLSFDLYGGVSPRRFDEFFEAPASPNQERKKSGKFVDLNRTREALMPVGAQEREVISGRIKFVVEKIREKIENPLASK